MNDIVKNENLNKNNSKFRFAKELIVFIVVLNIGILFSLIWIYKKIDKIPTKPIVIENNTTVKKDTIPTIEVEKNNILTEKYSFKFVSGQTILTPKIQKQLFSIYNTLEKNPNVNIEISGHTDNVGSDRTNLKISIKRAKLISDYLSELGVDKDRMKVNGYGEYQPIYDNTTKEGRDKNRRVEVIFKE